MIPKIIHFVYGLEENINQNNFSFCQWAAIKSAIKCNPSYRVIFWHKHLPNNVYFDDVRSEIELGFVDPPTEIFGRPLIHYAHKSDVVRLMVLIAHGGVYLDIDTITVKCFDEILHNKFVMGIEEAGGVEVGLCNAIMAGEPNSAFARKWLSAYETFRSTGHDAFWNEHSVQVPAQLAKSMPTDITILPNTAFFYPNWTRAGLEQMFYETHSFPAAIAHHLWASKSHGALNHLNESNVNYIKSSYTNIINRLIGSEVESLRLRRKAWVAEQIWTHTAKLNMGCGAKCNPLTINCDLFPHSGADLVFDMARDPWPLPDSSADFVILHHVIEHLSGDLQHFFRELYRVSKPSGIIDIRVPHPRHDWFLIDPTHCRPWHPESFHFLDRNKCLQWYFSSDSKSPLALYWEVDFETIESMVILADKDIQERISVALGCKPNPELSIQFLNNIAAEISVKLRARKNAT